jgi:hypothetical protein
MCFFFVFFVRLCPRFSFNADKCSFFQRKSRHELHKERVRNPRPAGRMCLSKDLYEVRGMIWESANARRETGFFCF